MGWKIYNVYSVHRNQLSKMKTAIVTGATSFIGLSLINRLLMDGVKVHAIVRKHTDTKRLAENLSKTNINVYDGTQASLINIFQTSVPDTVFHLAGNYVRDEKLDDVENLITSNVLFGCQLLSAILSSRVEYFINTGSYFQFSGQNENPVNLYGAAKNSFISILEYYSSLSNLKSTSLILYESYGPNDWRKKLFPTILNAIKNNIPLSIPEKETLLYPVYCIDIVDCYILAAAKLRENSQNTANQLFAVRHKNPCSIEEIINTFEEVSNRKLLVKPGGWPRSDREIFNIWRGSTLPDWNRNLI